MRLRAVPRARPDIRWGELASLAAGMLGSGRSAGPPAVFAFEREFARHFGAAGAVAFSSCRAAIYFSLTALGLSPGDEVILPAFAYPADAVMVELAGLKPVFADVDPGTANMDPEDAARRITPRTRVLFPTHLNGIPADVEALAGIARRHGLRLLEDCARACGIRAAGRTLGTTDIGVFSLGYGKNFDILGGGMAVSSDTAFLARLRDIQAGFRPPARRDLLLRAAKGIIKKAANEPYLFRFTLLPLLRAGARGEGRRLERLVKPPARVPGVPAAFSERLSGPQAAQGLRFLKRIDGHNLRRRNHAARLEDALGGLPGFLHFRASPGAERLYFVLGSVRRSAVRRFFYRHGIDAESDSAEALATAAGGCPRAGELAGKLFYLPNHPALTEGDLSFIIAKTREWAARKAT